MSEAAGQRAPAGPSGVAPVRVRAARESDVEAIVDCVRALLAELGGTPADAPAMRSATRAILETPSAGIVLVAEVDATILGVLAASWQIAIHVPGSYALIQDLWVDPAWRSRQIGGELVNELVQLARARDMSRVEVGLPREGFAGFAATEAFYQRSEFQLLGSRMRRFLT